MPSITKDEALEIGRSHFRQHDGIFRFTVLDHEPEGLCYYAAREVPECWWVMCIQVEPAILRGTPVVGISRETGEIVVDGTLGE